MLTNDKNEGGLKIFDSHHKDNALKLQWVKVYFHDNQTSLFADALLRNQIGYEIWNLNLKPEHVCLFRRQFLGSSTISLE